MTKLFLATHSKMASGMKASIDLLLGDSSCLTVFDAYLEGDNTTVQQAVESFLSNLQPGENAVLISDMLGGSVNQCLVPYANGANVFLITGITLQLLQALVLSCDETFTAEMLDELICEAREMTCRVQVSSSPVEESSFF